MTCKQCSIPISTVIGESIACDGPCKAVICRSCTGMTKAAVKAVSEYINLTYHCNSCFCFSIKEVAQSLNDVKASLVKISESVLANAANIANIAPALPLHAHIISGQVPSPGLKRRRVESVDSFPTPKLVENVIVGSDENSDLFAVEQRKQIVASLFHTSIKPEELCVHIKKHLNLSDEDSSIRCSLLLPAGRKIEELDFVSFKVVFPESMYSRILDPVLWPKGIRVRDFVHKIRNSRNVGHFLPPVLTRVPVENPVMNLI